MPYPIVDDKHVCISKEELKEICSFLRRLCRYCDLSRIDTAPLILFLNLVCRWVEEDG